VGINGTGTLSITGAVQFPVVALAFSRPTPAARARLRSSAPKHLDPRGRPFLGNNGSGALAIASGGSVSSSSINWLGVGPGSNGTLTVDGVGSSFKWYRRRECRLWQHWHAHHYPWRRRQRRQRIGPCHSGHTCCWRRNPEYRCAVGFRCGAGGNPERSHRGYRRRRGPPSSSTRPRPILPRTTSPRPVSLAVRPLSSQARRSSSTPPATTS